MIQLSTARTNRALAIALTALVRAQPKRSKRGRPRKGSLTSLEYREANAIVQALWDSSYLTQAHVVRLQKRIEREIGEKLVP